MSNYALKVKNLHYSYVTGKEVLKGVDLEVGEKEVVAILGPSGSGKTTILRCLSFLEKPTEGILEFSGKSYDMSMISKKEIKDIRMDMGFVFQSYNLFRNMTVFQNVMEGMTTARNIDAEVAKKKAEEVLLKVGMLDKKDKYPDELSGGQQQRVAIARAVALNPKVIFFDEPTSALDPELTKEVLDVMRRLAKSGTTMILVTHELEFAKEIASKIVFMEDGNVVEEGSADKMFNSPEKERTKQFFGNRGIL